MKSFIIFQGSSSRNMFLGTIEANDMRDALSRTAKRLVQKKYESVEVDEEITAVFFNTYFPKSQKNADVSEWGIRAKEYKQENDVWSTCFVTVVDSTEEAF